MGSTFYPLSEQIKDTAAVHGLLWAHWHYCIARRGPRLPQLQWFILSRQAYATL